MSYNHTPRHSYKVSAAGLSWLEHFRGFKDQDFVLQEVESRVCGFLKSFTLKGGARHQFINRE